jgi:hypothetical protein
MPWPVKSELAHLKRAVQSGLLKPVVPANDPLVGGLVRMLNMTDYASVRLDDLRAYAETRGEKPAFLYPEG